MIDITVDNASFQNAIQTIEAMGKSTSLMQMRALNKTVKGVKTDVSNSIRSRYNLLKSYIDDPKRKIIQTRFASLQKVEASVGVLAEFRPPLIAFTGTKQTVKGVSVKIRKDGNRTVIKHAFIGKMKSGHVGVFWRKAGVGESALSATEQKKRQAYRIAYFATLPKKDPMRWPITERFGPYLSTVIRDSGEYQKLQNQASARLDTNINHELDQQLKALA